MKRIIISLGLMMICIYGIAEEMKKNVNIASYNEFLEYFKTDLEAFSHRFSDFDSISEELKKGIFDMDYNILEHIEGCIYLVQTAQNAIDIANIIIGNLHKRKIGPFANKCAYSFKNLWIVMFQIDKTEKDIMRLDADTDLFIVISKHTAEVLMIW